MGRGVLECSKIESTFDVFNQLLIPGVSGLIGGLALVIIASLGDKYRVFTLRILASFYWKFGVIGAIAGIAAVNLLNPSGDISQVMILGLIAGLSGVTYLKRTALVDDVNEQLIFAAALNLAEESVFTDSVDQQVSVFVENNIEEDKKRYQEYMDKEIEKWLAENPNGTQDELDEFIEKMVKDITDNPPNSIE